MNIRAHEGISGDFVSQHKQAHSFRIPPLGPSGRAANSRSQVFANCLKCSERASAGFVWHLTMLSSRVLLTQNTACFHTQELRVLRQAQMLSPLRHDIYKQRWGVLFQIRIFKCGLRFLYKKPLKKMMHWAELGWAEHNIIHLGMFCGKLFSNIWTVLTWWEDMGFSRWGSTVRLTLLCRNSALPCTAPGRLSSYRHHDCNIK